jgi:N-acetylglucosaminyl-diphospho-decaprenol L-rhamnosyltransferase
MSDQDVKIVVSIVTWRAPALTIDCLASLEDQVTKAADIRIVVVDNASGDGTAEAIESAIRNRGWSGWAELIRSPVNGGFAAGNNVVCREALRRYAAFEFLLLLNPDTAVRRGAIGLLRDFMVSRPDVGIAGGRCENTDATPQECCFRFPGIISEFSSELRLGLFDRLLSRYLVRMGSFSGPVKVGWVAGALMMVRRKVIEAIGMMDEGYFLYFEETDFSLRAIRAGWSTWHVPSSRAIHYVGQLTGVQADDPRPRRMPAYWFESRRRYFVLNHGFLYAVMLDIGVLLGHLLWRLRRLLERKPDTSPPFWMGDLIRLGVLGRGSRGIPERRIR